MSIPLTHQTSYPSGGTIPPWTPSGVLPPFRGPDATVEAGFAPYATSLSEIINRFATSKRRTEILDGFLDFRASINGIGIVDGFQWIDGSFLEDVETLESRHPKDIDVVTIFKRPIHAIDDASWYSFFSTNKNKFSPIENKKLFKVDSHWIDLNIPPEFIVDRTRYWYGLFSHRRNGLWKGMLRVPLSISTDTDARALLIAKANSLPQHDSLAPSRECPQ